MLALEWTESSESSFRGIREFSHHHLKGHMGLQQKIPEGGYSERVQQNVKS